MGAAVAYQHTDGYRNHAGRYELYGIKKVGTDRKLLVPYSIIFGSSHKKITRQTLQNGEHIFRISYPRASQRTKKMNTIIRELHSGRTDEDIFRILSSCKGTQKIGAAQEIKCVL